MQDSNTKKPRRKYGKIKKTCASVEEAKEQQANNSKLIQEKLKSLSILKSLKVDTPWTTGSSDEGSNGYLYYKIQQAKKSKKCSNKFDTINQFLDSFNINQIDFSGLLRDTKFKQDSNTLFKKAQEMSKNKPFNKPSGLLMRRKMKMMSE